MSPQNSPDPKQNLKRYLHDFENARKELSEALESDKRIVDLAEKLEARMPELRGRAALETWRLGEETWFTGETWPRRILELTLCFRRNDLSLRTTKFGASEAPEDGH